jgi:hypothetical protein
MSTSVSTYRTRRVPKSIHWDSDALHLASARGITALESLQNSDGSFPLERRVRFDVWLTENPLFSTVTVLLSAGNLLNRECRDAALSFVLSQRLASGLWRFDSLSSLPADADDSACALACLYSWHPTALERSSVRALLDAFSRDDGRIVTWLTASGDLVEGQAADDLVVVANVLSALALEDAEYARQRFLAWSSSQSSTRAKRDLRTPYYAVSGNVQYAWRRASRLMHVTTALPAPRTDGSCLSGAFAAVCGVRHQVPHLLALQNGDGTWPREPWCVSPGAVFGSSAVTTAFVIEALTCAGLVCVSCR